MNFQDYLATFPSIDHLGGLDVQDAEGKTVHHIPAVQGKLGSRSSCTMPWRNVLMENWVKKRQNRV